jgi:F-box domain
MKSSVVPGYLDPADIQPSGGVQKALESLGPDHPAESPHSIPHHPLGIKPSGNQYTSSLNSKGSIGPFQLFPDEIIAIFLEYLDSCTLRCLGSTCKFLYAFCRSDDLWKSLFIE